MINQNLQQNKNRYFLQGIKNVYLTVDSIITELQGFRSASYECTTNDDRTYAFNHSLTINLPTNAYFILKDILDKDISFAFTTKNDDSFKLIEKCVLTYSFVIGEQPQFQLILQTPSNHPIISIDNVVTDEIIQLESCAYEAQNIDSLRIGSTDVLDVEIADDDFTISGTLFNIEAKNIQFEERYEDNIISQSINFSLPFNDSNNAFVNTLLKFTNNSYTALLYFNDTFIICGIDKGLLPSYNISENTINVSLSNSYTQHNTIITSNIANNASKDRYEIIEYKCYNNTNTATLLKKVGTNEYVCFQPYLAEYQYNYNIIETYDNIYTNKYGIKLYNDDVICSAGDECVIIGMPSKVSFNFVDEIKEFDVTSYCSIAFDAGNNADVTLYDGKLTIRNRSTSNYNIVCTDSNGYKRVIYVTIQNFTEIPFWFDINAYGGDLKIHLSNETSNIIEITSSIQYSLNASGAIIFEVPQNTTDDDIEYISRIYYNDNTVDVITITSKKGYTIKYYDGTVKCIDGDKWMMYNVLMGKTEDKIVDEVGYEPAYIIEKNSLECQDIKNITTLGTVTLYSQKHNVNEYLLSSGEIIYKVVNTNEYSALDNTLNFWEELEDMYIFDGQDTVYQDVLFVVFDDQAYRTDYTTPSLRLASNVDLSNIIQEKNTNSPLYKWADTGEIVEDDDDSINCTRSVPVEYDPSNSETWYCVEGVRYTISEEYIDTHCTGDWQFIGYSLAGTVGTFADQYVDCGLPEVGMFDVLIIYTDQRYKVDTYINGNILEGQYIDNTDIASIIIGDGIVSIGEYAFYNCTNLSSVTFGESIISIGDSAFENCKINLTDFNEKLVTIGNSAFYNNNLSNLTIPNSVESIGERAFASNINLTNIFITSSDTTVASNAFVDVAQEGIYICKCETAQEDALPTNWELECN